MPSLSRRVAGLCSPTFPAARGCRNGPVRATRRLAGRPRPPLSTWSECPAMTPDGEADAIGGLGRDSAPSTACSAPRSMLAPRWAAAHGCGRHPGSRAAACSVRGVRWCSLGSPTSAPSGRARPGLPRSCGATADGAGAGRFRRRCSAKAVRRGARCGSGARLTHHRSPRPVCLQRAGAGGPGGWARLHR